MSNILSPQQVELNAFINEENAAFEAECVKNGASCYCLFALTAVDLAAYGVYNIEQFKAWRDEIEQQENEKEQRKYCYDAVEVRADMMNERCYGMCD